MAICHLPKWLTDASICRFLSPTDAKTPRRTFFLQFFLLLLSQASHLHEGSVPRAHVAGRHSHVGEGLLGSPAPWSEACWVGGCGPPGTAGGPAQSSRLQPPAFSCPINAAGQNGQKGCVSRVCVYGCAPSVPLSRGLGKHMSSGRNQFRGKKRKLQQV